MLDITIDIGRLRRDRDLGDHIIFALEDLFEDAMDASPLLGGTIDPFEDIDRLRVRATRRALPELDALDGIPSGLDAGMHVTSARGANSTTYADDAGEGDRTPAIDVDDMTGGHGVDGPQTAGAASKATDEKEREPYAGGPAAAGDMPLLPWSFAALLEGTVDVSELLGRLTDGVDEGLVRGDVRGVEWVGHEAVVAAELDGKLVVTSGVEALETLVDAARGDTSDADGLGAILDPTPGSGRVIDVHVDGLETFFGGENVESLPESIQGLSRIQLTIDILSGELDARAEARVGTDGTARVAVTGFEAARAAWALAGWRKRWPDLAPAIEKVSAESQGSSVVFTLSLTTREARAFVDELADMMMTDELDEDFYADYGTDFEPGD